MAQRGFTAGLTTAAVTSTAKTLINIIADAGNSITITAIHISADATVNVLIELCESTQAGTGTTGTAPTVKQVRGFVGADGVAPDATVNGTYSAEPTVLTRLYAWRFVGPGPLIIYFPLGREPQSLVSGATKYKSLAFRVTSPTSVNVDLTVEFEE